MQTLDALFRQKPDALSHPRLRRWRAFLERPDAKAELEVFRPVVPIGQASTELTLRLSENGGPPAEVEFLWDEVLNDGLVKLGVRAADAGQEALRFANMLREACNLASRQYGDGYLNHALRSFLEGSDLAQYPAIASVLEGMHPNHLPEDERIAELRDMVADAVSGRAHELVENLRYTEDEAKAILVAAIARYIDDRFSISYRRQRGLL